MAINRPKGQARERLVLELQHSNSLYHEVSQKWPAQSLKKKKKEKQMWLFQGTSAHSSKPQKNKATMSRIYTPVLATSSFLRYHQVVAETPRIYIAFTQGIFNENFTNNSMRRKKKDRSKGICLSFCGSHGRIDIDYAEDAHTKFMIRFQRLYTCPMNRDRQTDRPRGILSIQGSTHSMRE